MPSITRELYEQATDKKGSLSKKARDASVAVCGWESLLSEHVLN